MFAAKFDRKAGNWCLWQAPARWRRPPGS